MITSAQKLLMARAGVPSGPSGPAEYIGFNDTNLQGSYTLDYPTGTQSGDLLLLFCGNDNGLSADPPSGWTTVSESSAMSNVYYRFAESPSGSVIAPSRAASPEMGGAIICTFRNTNFVQSADTSAFGTTPFSFPTLSGASIGRTCVCFAVTDDDVPTAEATQTGFIVAVSDFYGTGQLFGCSMHVTYALEVIDTPAYTPPSISISGVASEAYSTFTFEII